MNDILEVAIAISPLWGAPILSILVRHLTRPPSERLEYLNYVNQVFPDIRILRTQGEVLEVRSLGGININYANSYVDFDRPKISTNMWDDEVFWRFYGRIYHGEKPNQGLRLWAPQQIKPHTVTLVSESKAGRLWRLFFTWHDSSRTARVSLLEVWNATLEKDGSRQRFLLRVPRQMLSVDAAVAWTFNLAPHQYRPQKES